MSSFRLITSWVLSFFVFMNELVPKSMFCQFCFHCWGKNIESWGISALFFCAVLLNFYWHFMIVYILPAKIFNAMYMKNKLEK